MIRTNLSVCLLLVSMFLNLTEKAAAQDLAEDALRATIRITKGPASGTGFFVAIGEPTENPRRHVLVTAAHVFQEMSGLNCTLVLRSKGPNGDFVRKETELVIRSAEKPLWVRHPELDVAAIAMQIPDGIDIKPFDYRQIADASWVETRKIRVGHAVCIPCFPAKVEGNPAGWPILRKGSIATHPLIPLSNAKTIFVDYAHFGGDSGAPVVAQGDQETLVIGLVFAMLRQTDKSVSPFEERTTHTPLGLAVTIQSPFIRQTIDLLPTK